MVFEKPESKIDGELRSKQAPHPGNVLATGQRSSVIVVYFAEKRRQHSPRFGSSSQGLS